jgi:hypothetical protein
MGMELMTTLAQHSWPDGHWAESSQGTSIALPVHAALVHVCVGLAPWLSRQQ